MVEIQIKRVDMYDIGNDSMIVDVILYNPNTVNVIVGIDIYVPSPYGNKLLNLTQPVHISTNSYTVFRSNMLKFVPEVTVGIRRCLTTVSSDTCQEYSEEEDSIMVGNFVSGNPPNVEDIKMVGMYEYGYENIHENSSLIVPPSPLTLQVERINMFDGAPTLFYGSYVPNTKISVYNDDTKKVLVTAQTGADGKYSVNNDMVFGQSNIVTFSIRSCVTKADNILDLTRVSNLVAMTIKPVSVVRYPVDARYTGIRDRENGTISIPTKYYPSRLDALSALKTKTEKLVSDTGGTLLRFEYGYTSTTNNHIYDVTYYYTRNVLNAGNSIINDNIINMSSTDEGTYYLSTGNNPTIQSLIWWMWLLYAIAAAVIIAVILEVVIRSGLKNLLPTWLQDKIVAASDFLKSGISTVATGIVLVAAGYIIITFGPAIINYFSARKTEKALKKTSEPKRIATRG